MSICEYREHIDIEVTPKVTKRLHLHCEYSSQTSKKGIKIMKYIKQAPNIYLKELITDHIENKNKFPLILDIVGAKNATDLGKYVSKLEDEILTGTIEFRAIPIGMANDEDNCLRGIYSISIQYIG